jgi:hypothetical protein
VTIAGVLDDAFGRLPDCWAPADGANPVGWLIWHLTRVQDHHIADVLGTDQVYVSGSWAQCFGREPDPSDIGYGHSAADVAAVRPQGWEALVDYHTAVYDRTREFLHGLEPADLDRVVDESWDPPVTLGVRLVSILADDLQHIGQAAYVRGLLR